MVEPSLSRTVCPPRNSSGTRGAFPGYVYLRGIFQSTTLPRLSFLGVATSRNSTGISVLLDQRCSFDRQVLIIA